MPTVLACQQELIALFDGQVAAVEAELKALVAEDTAWAASIRLLQTIPASGR